MVILINNTSAWPSGRCGTYVRSVTEPAMHSFRESEMTRITIRCTDPSPRHHLNRKLEQTVLFLGRLSTWDLSGTGQGTQQSWKFWAIIRPPKSASSSYRTKKNLTLVEQISAVTMPRKYHHHLQIRSIDRPLVARETRTGPTASTSLLTSRFTEVKKGANKT